MSGAAADRPVLIAAGGTGGHLFPARALAEELARRRVPVDLVTDVRGQHFDEGFPARAVHSVPAATPVGRSPLKAVAAAATLARGVVAARSLIRLLRPRLVAGFGGYPTVPPLIAAWTASVPTLIHDQNAVMGRANRLLARIAGGIALSVARPVHAGPAVLAKAVLTGNPVRDAVVAARETAYSAPAKDDRFRLLVFGGSQGAHVFSELVPAALGRLDPAERSRISLVQQCRPEDLEAVRASCAGLGLNAELAPFFPDLPARIAAAHLVVSRSGASTVAEIAAIGRPAILVPLPHAIDNDQLENARALAAAGGGFLIEQHDLDAERLAGEIRGLMESPDRLAAAAAAARKAGRPDAVATLADFALHLAAGGKPSGFAEAGSNTEGL